MGGSPSMNTEFWLESPKGNLGVDRAINKVIADRVRIAKD
jgi:hypothetical protein